EQGFFRAIPNWFLIAGCRLDIWRAGRDKAAYIEALNGNIARLDQLQNSPGLAGARAELAVIEQLKRLPEGYVVLNDVRLRARRFHRYNGVPLQSAQIDHLVISPAGLFVIETKVWSRQFVESGDYHDPFDQVGRAGYLCYDNVKQFGKVQVRSIIAAAGHLPAKPDEAKVKVVKVEALAGYIAWFKEKEVNPGLLAQLKGFLGHRVGVEDYAGGAGMLLDLVLRRKRRRGFSGGGLWKGYLFSALLIFAFSYLIKDVSTPLIHFGSFLAPIFYAAGSVFLVLALGSYAIGKVRAMLLNKVAEKTGMNAWGRSRRNGDLIEAGVTLIAAMARLIIPKIRIKIVEPAGTGQAPVRRAVLIPTEPPPLSKEERDRKYMPPAMRAELEAREKDFTDAHPVCPHCNKPLVLRVSNRPPDEGKRFWGCPGYPACRHTAPFLEN
ncbi:MAG: NERD domain-containing protein, partial [Elusimicrobiales bacterium]|nr:NERD domain-containing protein [Elusimicrobiales bacterium]